MTNPWADRIIGFLVGIAFVAVTHEDPFAIAIAIAIALGVGVGAGAGAGAGPSVVCDHIMPGSIAALLNCPVLPK